MHLAALLECLAKWVWVLRLVEGASIPTAVQDYNIILNFLNQAETMRARFLTI